MDASAIRELAAAYRGQGYANVAVALERMNELKLDLTIPIVVDGGEKNEREMDIDQYLYELLAGALRGPDAQSAEKLTTLDQSFGAMLLDIIKPRSREKH